MTVCCAQKGVVQLQGVDDVDPAKLLKDPAIRIHAGANRQDLYDARRMRQQNIVLGQFWGMFGSSHGRTWWPFFWDGAIEHGIVHNSLCTASTSLNNIKERAEIEQVPYLAGSIPAASQQVAIILGPADVINDGMVGHILRPHFLISVGVVENKRINQVC